MMLRLDLHVHTHHSEDCFSSIEEVIKAAQASGLNGIAITDHNSVNGLKEIENFKDFLVIPGVEVSSKDGHVLGLGVREPIPPGLSARETVELIRQQGGVAIAAHPFGLWKRVGSVYKARFDAIEVFNSRAYFVSNGLAKRFAEQNHLPMVAGSDAHHPSEVGLAGVELDCKPKLSSILKAIGRGETSIFGRSLPPAVYLWRALHKLFHRAKRA